MASSSSESVPCLLRPTFAQSLPTLFHTPTSCVSWTWLWECHYIVTQSCWRAVFTSIWVCPGRTGGTCRTVWSSWLSLIGPPSCQSSWTPGGSSRGLLGLCTGYLERKTMNTTDYSTYTHGWINMFRVRGASISCWAPFAPLTPPACICAMIPPFIMHKADYTIQSLHW